MTTYPIYGLVFLCFACTTASSPPIPNAYADSVFVDAQTPLRDTENELYFSDVLIYEYQTSEGEKGECWIYLNPETGRILFTKESWGASDEMSNFIVANPDGSYLQFYTDAEGDKDAKKVIQHRLTNIQVSKNRSNNVFIDDAASTANQVNQESTIANLKSQAYEINYQKMNGKETLWLTQVPFNTHLLYGFSKLDIEAQLPIHLDYSSLVQNNQLVTQCESSSYAYHNGEKKEYISSFRLVSFEPTSYYVPYKAFTYYEKEGDSWIKKTIPITLNPQKE